MSKKEIERVMDIEDPKQLTNHMVFLVDRSGSMERIRDETIEFFNLQVRNLKELAESSKQKTTVTLITFGGDNIAKVSVDDPVLWVKPVEELKELTENSYKPKGGTPLYDAVGYAIDNLRKIEDADHEKTSFVLCIITDGEENSSVKYTAEQIANRIKECQETKRWTITYMGADVDLSEIQKLGVSAQNTVSFGATSGGVKKAAMKHRLSTQSFYSSRAAGGTSVDDFYKNKIKCGCTDMGACNH